MVARSRIGVQWVVIFKSGCTSVSRRGRRANRRFTSTPSNKFFRIPCWKPPLPPGEGWGEGDRKMAHKLPLILTFSRREKGPFVLCREQNIRKNLSDAVLAGFKSVFIVYPIGCGACAVRTIEF